MAKNGARKGFYLALHANEGLEKLKVRASSDTAHFKAELISLRKGVERAEHKRYAVDNLQIQVYEMWAEMIKTYWLDMWAKNMEGAITLFLSILDNRMRKLGIGGGIISGG